MFTRKYFHPDAELQGENVNTSESDDIVVNVISGSTPEQQLEVLQNMLKEARERESTLKKQLEDAQKTNLHLAMTMSNNDNNASRSFEDILRGEAYYKKIMERK